MRRRTRPVDPGRGSGRRGATRSRRGTTGEDGRRPPPGVPGSEVLRRRPSDPTGVRRPRSRRGGTSPSPAPPPSGGCTGAAARRPAHRCRSPRRRRRGRGSAEHDTQRLGQPDPSARAAARGGGHHLVSGPPQEIVPGGRGRRGRADQLAPCRDPCAGAGLDVPAVLPRPGATRPGGADAAEGGTHGAVVVGVQRTRRRPGAGGDDVGGGDQHPVDGHQERVGGDRHGGRRWRRRWRWRWRWCRARDRRRGTVSSSERSTVSNSGPNRASAELAVVAVAVYAVPPAAR